MKPNFFVIGAAKCGTTSFCDFISQHPEVFFCPQKEPRFFSHDNRYGKGIEHYEKLFAKSAQEKRVGEGSTTYAEAWLSRAEKSASRIHSYCPDAKIFYCVRDPLERIESKWLDLLLTKDNGWTNTELTRSGTLKLTGDFNEDIKNHPEFVNTSNYWQQLLTYQKYFPSENIKIIFFEDFKENAEAVLEEASDFLGITPKFSFQINSDARNQTSTKGLSTSFGRLLRTLPGYKRLAQNSPSSLRSMVSLFTKRKFTHRPTWAVDTRSEVVEELKFDLIKFLIHCKKPTDFWQSLV